MLYDTLELPEFTGEINWTSSLRSRAAFPPCGREVTDFEYEDTQGALTRQFLHMQHPYATPAWLSTACDNRIFPLYRLEVKSTTSQDPTTTSMSGHQHEMVSFSQVTQNVRIHFKLTMTKAKQLRVTSETPSEVYVILRISGLDALEDGAGHRPKWRVYLDPYARSEEGLLRFVPLTYAVTATH